MNKIKEQLDLIFSKYEETDELRILKEEILSNAMDRFKDDILAGMSEEEAIENVFLALGNLDTMLVSIGAREVHEESGPSDLFSRLFSTHCKEEEEGTPALFEAIRNLAVQGKSMDVIIQESPDESVHVHTRRNPEAVQFSVAEDTLRIEEVTLAGSFFRPSPSITIEVPTVMGSLDLSTSSGDIRIGNIQAETLDIHSASGDALLDRIRIPEIRIKCLSGDIEASHIFASEKVVLNVTSGDIEFQADGRIDDLEVSTVSGDLDLDYRKDFERIKVRSSSGDLDLNLRSVDAIELHASVVSGELVSRKEELNNAPIVEVRTLSGDISIR